MRAAIALLALPLLLGCEDRHASPHMASVCTRNHVNMLMLPMMIGKITVMHAQPTIICDKRETRCVWGSKYSGPKQCAVKS